MLYVFVIRNLVKEKSKSPHETKMSSERPHEPVADEKRTNCAALAG